MKFKLLAVVLILSLLVIAPGCGPATPTCTLGELQAAYLMYPTMWETVWSWQPTLVWTYPAGPYGEYPSTYYGASNCLPENYRVTLRTGPFFTDNLGGDTTNAAGSWVPPTVLQPGTEYAWAIQPLVGGVPGPIAGYRYFFTGPTCETAALVAPNLLEPANGAVITDNWPSLIWDYPLDCVPNGYRIDLSTHSDFSDTSLSGGTGNPSTRWGAGHPLDDCTTYYWKVAPINGTTLGPVSSTFHFQINMTGGICPLTFDWPIYKVLQNASCRFGPGLDYNIMDYLAAGDERQAEGRNEDGSWLILRLDANRRCWVARNLGELLPDDPLNLPLAEYPARPLPGPTDTPTPVPSCSAYQDQTSCENYGCRWVYSQTRAPYCTNK
jgi:hypothetical protein